MHQLSILTNTAYLLSCQSTGCGKTTIWKTLVNAHNYDQEKRAYKAKRTCVYETVNPKAVTGDELYGYMTLSKDW